MAHIFCRNTDGFKKWKTGPLVVCAVTVIFCVFGFCVYGRTNIFSYSSSEYKRPMAFALKANQDYLQQIRKLVNTRRTSISARRLLGGIGSSTPSCTSKCGRCVPCKPVQLTVLPGTRMSNTEYYPLAWRCKCGNRLYMP